MITAEQFLIRLRELVDREEPDKLLHLSDWALARPDMVDSDRANILAFRAQGFLLLGNPVKAAECVDQAKQISITIEVVYAAITMYLAVEQNDMARLLLDEQWELLSHRPRCLVLAARVLMACGEVGRAQNMLQEMVESEAPPRGSFRALAELLLRYKGAENALEYARAATIRGYPGAGDLLLYARALLASGKYADAVTIFETALFVQPEQNGIALLGSIESLIRLREYAHANQLLDVTIKAPVVTVEISLDITRLMILLGRAEEAAKIYHQILQQVPKHPASAISLALISNHEGRTDDAEAFLKLAAKSLPENDKSLIPARAEHALLIGDLKQAWRYISPFLQQPGPPVPDGVHQLVLGGEIAGKRILVRACHPVRFLGFIPALVEAGAEVWLLSHELERDTLLCLVEVPVLVPADLEQSFPFDAVIDDVRLPLFVDHTSWPSFPQDGEPDKDNKRIGLAIHQPTGAGKGFDYPDDFSEKITELLHQAGYQVIEIEVKSELPAADLLSMSGMIASDHLVMDTAAALGVHTVLVVPLVADPLWRCPGIADKLYPWFEVVVQPQQGGWEGVAETVVAKFTDRQIH